MELQYLFYMMRSAKGGERTNLVGNIACHDATGSERLTRIVTKY